MAKYAILLQYTLNGSKRTTMLYAIDESKVGVGNVVTDHPIANGTYVSDHMYRSPTTYNISGTFAKNGDCFWDLKLHKNISIAQFQQLFEDIANYGIVCSVMKGMSDSSNNDSYTFTERRNMILERLTWTEGLNTLDYTFDFREVLFAQVQDVPFDPSGDIIDKDPYMIENVSVNGYTAIKFNPLGNLSTTGTQLGLSLMKVLVDNGYISQKTMDEYVRKYNYGVWDALSFAANAAGTIGAVGAGGGTYVGGGAGAFWGGLFGLLFGGIGGLAELTTTLEANAGFYIEDWVNDPLTMNYRGQAFTKFANDLLAECNRIVDSFNAWSIQSIEEPDYHPSMVGTLSVGNNTYEIRFDYNQERWEYMLKVYSLEGLLIRSVLVSSAITSIIQSNASNALFSTPDGHYLFLLNLNPRNKMRAKPLSDYGFVDLPYSPSTFRSHIAAIAQQMGG